MTQSKSSGTQNKQSAHQSEAQQAESKAGMNVDKSSHNNKAHVKAGKDTGAGGGAKQKKHR